MSIQMALFSGGNSSRITAIRVDVSAFGPESVTGAISFLSNGQQTISRDGSVSIVANWVTPTLLAGDWEIRAVLESGDSPSQGVLNTWLPLTSNRSWVLSRSTEGFLLTFLTFEFRRVGSTDPEVSITGNSISVESSGGIRP